MTGSILTTTVAVLIRKAGKILVVQQGRIVEEGDHKRLMSLGGEYRRLYQMQFRDTDEIVTGLRAEGVA